MSAVGEIWPRESPKADPAKLLAFAKEQIQAAETTLKILDQPPPAATVLADMPEGVLGDGYLAEIRSRCMGHFPMAYAAIALVTTASALVPRVDGVRVNMFGAEVGPKASGKTKANEFAQTALGITPPQILDVMAGSAEGLIQRLGDAAGNPRLASFDELGHLLEKSQIQNASFPYVLNRAFYSDRFEVLMARGQSTIFHASLSILGGLTDDKFQDLFGAATIAGLHDRFIFGACPGGFKFDFRPFDGIVERRIPTQVTIGSGVWDAKKEWLDECQELEPRVVELALRFATICASFDGRDKLMASDLGPARQFADYQMRIRRVLKPNAGENFEGRCALKMIDYLKQFGGKFVGVREMLRACNTHRFGPSVAERALKVLDGNGEIEIVKQGRMHLVRLVPDDEKEQ
jgi:hypothetical protein